MNAASLSKRVQVAAKQVIADVVLKGGTIVNVFTGEPMQGDIAIVDGIIAGIGSYEGKETVDVSGKWIVPGLIDGHVHIESTMLTPREFAKVSLQHGVTSVITDPHEIANVAGTKGIQYMLEQSEELPFDIFTMLPSCVPVTPYESNGANVGAEDLAPFYNHPKVIGLAEMMDFAALSNQERGMLDKITSAHNNGKRIDGHAAGIAREDLNLYMSAGIRTDHECVNVAEAKDRLNLGMYLMIREGTVAKDLRALVPVVTAQNARRCLFVTDDKLIDDLVDEGSIDHNVRLAIQEGISPCTAVQMATLNTAECFGLADRGAIAPGYQADLVVLDDLDTFSIHQVFKRGKCVVDQGELIKEAFAAAPAAAEDKGLTAFHTAELSEQQLAIPLSSDLCNVIEIIPNSLVTIHRQEIVDRVDGCFVPSVTKDQLKLAVIERHKATGNIGLGIVKGFQFTHGAIASSVAHDSHNLIVAGASDAEMLTAARHVIQMKGGLAVVSGSEVLASLPLPVAGLLSEWRYEEVYACMKQLNEALRAIGTPATFNPFLTLSFLALPVIPHLKLTDKGLFEFASHAHIGIQASSLQ
ncbi:adenine deaminase [Paenibacillus sp. GCM10027626]|uniref:adenine deaminase n=1 Tax=Paenibacillus sp. GCM10027626 TaxID=3273411 RepID=UPI003645A65B